MDIKGLVKTSLVDYPGYVAATLFVGECNMRCPFCHNKMLVTESKNLPTIKTEDVFEFIQRRAATLEAVCITGGEPTLSSDLIPFLKSLREYPIKIKLDTNGLRPSIIEEVISLQLTDYIAMDIKNSKQRYAVTTGLSKIDIEKIEASINLIKNAPIDYEFRTTVMKEFHDRESLLDIGMWLQTSKNYYLQSYVYRDSQLDPRPFTSFSIDELTDMTAELTPFFTNIGIRS